MPKGTKTARAAIPERRRIQLGLIVSAETKALIEEEAQRSGRTQSQVAEMLIEKSLTYERTIAAMNATLDALQHRNIHSAMMHEGYHPQRTRYGMAYLPPATPLDRSGFQLWDPDELPPAAVELPKPEPLPDRTAEALAELEAKIEARLAGIEALIRKPSGQDR